MGDLYFLNQFVEQLPREIQDSLIWYTRDSDELNTALRKGSFFDKEQIYHLKNIDKVFREILKTKEPLTVYRGIDTDTLFPNKTYISTSLTPEIAFEFSDEYNNCCIIQITVSPGSKIIPLLRKNISRFLREQEILLDRFGDLIVTGSDIKKYKNGEMKYIFATYIPHGSVHFEESVGIDDVIDVIEHEPDVESYINRVVDLLQDDIEFVDDDEIIMMYKKIAGNVPTQQTIDMIFERLGFL